MNCMYEVCNSFVDTIIFLSLNYNLEWDLYCRLNSMIIICRLLYAAIYENCHNTVPFRYFFFLTEVKTNISIIMRTGQKYDFRLYWLNNIQPHVINRRGYGLIELFSVSISSTGSNNVHRPLWDTRDRLKTVPWAGFVFNERRSKLCIKSWYSIWVILFMREKANNFANLTGDAWWSKFSLWIVELYCLFDFRLTFLVAFPNTYTNTNESRAPFYQYS